MLCSANTSIQRGSGEHPTFQSAMAALSMNTLSAAIDRRTDSAIGERQEFPVKIIMFHRLEFKFSQHTQRALVVRTLSKRMVYVLRS